MRQAVKRAPTDKRPRVSRCWACGRMVYRSAYPDEEPKCAAHPDAEMIPWPHGRAFAIADDYLDRVVGHGLDPERWIRTRDPRMFPGASDADLAFVWSCRQRWGGWEHRAIGELPDTAERPISLYSGGDR